MEVDEDKEAMTEPLESPSDEPSVETKEEPIEEEGLSHLGRTCDFFNVKSKCETWKKWPTLDAMPLKRKRFIWEIISNILMLVSQKKIGVEISELLSSIHESVPQAKIFSILTNPLSIRCHETLVHR